MIGPLSFKADDPWPSNRWFDEMLRKAIRGRLLSTGPGIERTGAGLSRSRPAEIWAYVTGTGNPYAFQEATPSTAGGFAIIAGGTTDDGGAQPAYEINDLAGLGNTYQRLVFAESVNDWRFQNIAYGGWPLQAGPVQVPNCFCDPVPSTLSMISSSSTCNYGMFQSCAIQWGPTPIGYADLDLGAYSFLSVESFPDAIANGAMFQYLLTCQYNQFNLSRVYLSSPYGSPYRDGILYTWVLGSYGNSCIPFELTNGVSFAGSDADCYVQIFGE